MGELCAPIRADCAHAFKEISSFMAAQVERDKAIVQHLESISVAVTGNGNPQASLIDRMARREEADRGRDRTLKVIMVGASILMVIVTIINVLI